MQYDAKIKRSNIVNTIARNFKLHRDLFNTVDDSGNYEHRRFLLHATARNEQWLLHITQNHENEPTVITVYHKENLTVRRYVVRAEELEESPTEVIRYVTTWLRSRLQPRLPLDQDVELAREMARLLGAAVGGDTVYAFMEVGAIETSENGLNVKMIYKSERTTYDGVPYKILIFRVTDNAGRDELYRVAFRVGRDEKSANSMHAYLRAIGQYNNGDHKAMLRTLDDSNYHSCIHKFERGPYPKTHSCVNITAPKCYDPEDPRTAIHDATFSFLGLYQVVSAETAMDSVRYYTLVNDVGDEVSRRQNFFVDIPVKGKK